MLDQILLKIKKVIPYQIFKLGQPIYHYSLALYGAFYFGFPSEKIKIIGVTGTKGKSTTTEIINSILEEAGYKTALSNTIRYKIGEKSIENKFKMSMPGRFFVQRLIKDAVKNKCDYLILEMTSQGTLQYRHKFIKLNALVFTNLSPEHIESHGTYEKYVEAKLKIAEELERSTKRPRIMIVNGDDKESSKFLSYKTEIQKTYSLKDAVPANSLLGDFNKYNILAAVTLAKALEIKNESIEKAIKNFKEIPGRVQFIKAGQNFDVIVDYAHTPDSLRKLYEIFKGRKICVLGGTGGGRDNWKRKEMGMIADNNCDKIILTNEDPYDENPVQIVNDVASGIKNKKAKIIMDRRQAIAEALKSARENDTVLITGKGTDPFIMIENGKKIPWSDANVAKEEISKLLSGSRV